MTPRRQALRRGVEAIHVEEEQMGRYASITIQEDVPMATDPTAERTAADRARPILNVRLLGGVSVKRTSKLVLLCRHVVQSARHGTVFVQDTMTGQGVEFTFRPGEDPRSKVYGNFPLGRQPGWMEEVIEEVDRQYGTIH